MSKSTIAIIGGGFCGTLAAVHLLRNQHCANLHVVLVNRSGPLARGVAYGTRTETHVLNVPAGRMGALPDDEEDFLRFARRRDPSVDSGAFLPRQWYGEYLEWLLEDACARALPSVRFSHRIGHVVDLIPQPGVDAGDEAVDIVFEDGDRLRADRVVLALGNFTPSDPPLADRSFYEHSARYIRDPWLPGALEHVDQRRPVLLIGTGLTAVDVALDLVDRGLSQPVYALSRRGLAPLTHRGLAASGRALVESPQALWDAPGSARHYVRVLRAQIAELAERGIDWRDAIAALRSVTPQLWQRLDHSERARFLRHLQVYWEIHRHRLAPALGQRFSGLIESGRLHLRAGRLRGLQENGDGVDVCYQPRGTRELCEFRVGSVINCTGPNSNMARSSEPLLGALSRRGLLQSNPLGLGVAVSDHYALLGADGRASSILFYVGPFLKAHFWEATAVPELRVHVFDLVSHLLGNR